MNKRAVIILDTNIFMQFDVWSDKINWKLLIEEDTFDFVLPIIVIQEIQNLKDGDSRSYRQKNRASQCGRHFKRMLAKLGTNENEIEYQSRKYIIDIESQKAISSFKEKFPTTECTPDSQVLGCALAFVQEEMSVYLATEDQMLSALAIISGVTCIQPPDENRVKETESPLEEDLRKTKQELQKYKSRQPRINFGVSSSFDNFSELISYADIYPDKEEREKGQTALASAKSRLLELQNITTSGQRTNSLGASFVGLHALRQEPGWRAHVEDLEDWLEAQSQLELHRSKYKILMFYISNHGNMPAKNVDITISVNTRDSDFKLSTDPPYRTPPIPSNPEAEQINALRFAAQSAMNTYNNDVYEVENIQITKASKDEICISISRLVHDDSKTESIGPFFVLTSSPFGAQYRISCDEIPDIIDGELGFRV